MDDFLQWQWWNLVLYSMDGGTAITAQLYVFSWKGFRSWLYSCVDVGWSVTNISAISNGADSDLSIEKLLYRLPLIQLIERSMDSSFADFCRPLSISSSTTLFFIIIFFIIILFLYIYIWQIPGKVDSLRLKHDCVGEKSALEHGNFCLISARLSLRRHYPFPYYYQSNFWLLANTGNI